MSEIHNKLRRVEITADGSATIYLPDMDEHYHSIKGALTESNHIFRDSALRHCEKSCVRVLEVGFGTGLNAAVTAIDKSKVHIDYFSLELYPLTAEEIAALGYDSLLDDEGKALYHAIHSAAWNKCVAVNERFNINKIVTDFLDVSKPIPGNIDVCYMDAFAPEKQPEMWSEQSLGRLYDAMRDGGILTTYCAKGEIRRRLQSIGFVVERIPGPIGGKREILRATK